ncbi:hypothetical protein [Bradyrhizobium sp. Leo121]|uniref:hypothetical protein n=1 Tax=Bradyrhizobium sp. Leo121 TaxID=1571195 RepID=UPI00102A3DAE|nr:hypothetical protein [Bradyrhizobium sp. Leo121]
MGDVRGPQRAVGGQNVLSQRGWMASAQQFVNYLNLTADVPIAQSNVPICLSQMFQDRAALHGNSSVYG